MFMGCKHDPYVGTWCYNGVHNENTDYNITKKGNIYHIKQGKQDKLEATDTLIGVTLGGWLYQPKTRCRQECIPTQGGTLYRCD